MKKKYKQFNCIDNSRSVLLYFIIYLILTQYGIQDIYIEKIQMHKQQIDIIADSIQ